MTSVRWATILIVVVFEVNGSQFEGHRLSFALFPLLMHVHFSLLLLDLWQW